MGACQLCGSMCSENDLVAAAVSEQVCPLAEGGAVPLAQAAPELFTKLLGPQLVVGRVSGIGKAIVPVPTADLFAGMPPGPRVLGLYFAARCCSEATNGLVAAYAELQRRGLAVVYVSQDHPEAFEEHFRTMPWHAVRPSDAAQLHRRLAASAVLPQAPRLPAGLVGEALGVGALPSLLLLDASGLLTTEGFTAVMFDRCNFPWSEPPDAEPTVVKVRYEAISSASCDLLEALRSQDYVAAQKALDNGANANAVYRFKDARTRSAYMAAGANVDGCGPCHRFPEGCSAMYDTVEAVCPALCVALGAVGPAPPGRGVKATPCRLSAAQAGELEAVVRRLLEAKADPDGHGLEVDDDGSGGYYDPKHRRTPLQLAARFGSERISQMLRDFGATKCKA